MQQLRAFYPRGKKSGEAGASPFALQSFEDFVERLALFGADGFVGGVAYGYQRADGVALGEAEEFYYLFVGEAADDAGREALLRGFEDEVGGRHADVAFGEALREKSGLEVVYMDERLTTVSAERMLIGADVRREKRKKVIDKVAATIILQSYLDGGGRRG